MYQIHSKGVGHHENYNYRKKYRTDRGIKGSGRGEAFQTGEVFRTGYRCICYIKRGEGAPEEVTIPIKGHVIRSEQSSNDMYVSIDLVEEVIERQLRKYRTKLASKKMNVAENFSEAFIDSDADEDEEIKIVRTKRFGMKPMYPEDACVQMELTGHDFFVFRNAETDEVNVVYKRKGNTFGLIEPEC